MSMLLLSQNNWGWSFGIKVDVIVVDQISCNVLFYFIGVDGFEILGLKLLEGCFFNDGEYVDSYFDVVLLVEMYVVMIIWMLVEKLWLGQLVVGKMFYLLLYYYMVVGVVGDVLCLYIGGVGGLYNYDVVYFLMSVVGLKGVLGYYVLCSVLVDCD